MPLSPDAAAEAADLLADLRLRANGRTAPIAALPEAIRPADLADAYAVQALLRANLAARGLGAPVGWKIGCTTKVMQDYLGVPHPCLGTLHAAGVHRDRARLRAADHFRLGLECEIAARLGADLLARPGGHDAASVAGAVAGVMTSIEIVEERFADFRAAGAPSLAADDFFSCGCILGEEVPPGVLPDLAALTGGFRVDGAAPETAGGGAAILGHPLAALAWLADLRAAQGEPLRSGEIATLGSVVRTIYPQAGVAVEARFDGLPPATAEIV